MAEIKKRINRQLPNMMLILMSVVMVAGILFTRDAAAIDGNYWSPYATQWSARSVGVSIPNETLVGMLLVMLNVAVAGTYFVRDKLRLRRRRI